MRGDVKAFESIRVGDATRHFTLGDGVADAGQSVGYTTGQHERVAWRDRRDPASDSTFRIAKGVMHDKRDVALVGYP